MNTDEQTNYIIWNEDVTSLNKFIYISHIELELILQFTIARLRSYRSGHIGVPVQYSPVYFSGKSDLQSEFQAFLWAV